MRKFIQEKTGELQRKRQARSDKPKPLEDKEIEERAIRGYFTAVMALILFVFCSMPVYASSGDPLQTINNLSDFIFGAIKAIGFIMLGFGIVQIGLSLKSHDASQRANGLMTFFGGIIIAFSKNILDLILS